MAHLPCEFLKIYWGAKAEVKNQYLQVGWVYIKLSKFLAALISLS